LRTLEALAKLAEGKAAEAAALVEPVSFRASLQDVVNIWTVAKMEAGDNASAEKGLTWMISSDARRGLSATAAWVHASLGRVYARMGNVAAARKSYEKCFDLFKDADPDLPLLVQAREEYAKLAS
jgi:hypothetical protein